MTDVDKEWKGASFKEEEDYSDVVNQVLESCNATTAPALLRSQCGGSASVEQKLDVLCGILEPLFALEKKARLGGDNASCKRVAVELLTIYRELGFYDAMLKIMLELMKKRSQSKLVQTAMVETCAVVLTNDLITDTARRIEVLERLAYATENKIHAELHHARFSAELAKLHEDAGLKQKASAMLASLQVETITSMPRVEKLHILNTQIRLALELDLIDHIPSISRKISYRALAREEALEERLHYFALMREFYTRNNESYFQVGRCWLETFRSLNPSTAARERIHALRSAVLFYLISDYSTEKEVEDACEFTAFSPETRFPDRTRALQGLCETYHRDLEDVPQFHSLLQRFNSIVLVREKVQSAVEQLCATDENLGDFPSRQDLLRNRCSEHDLMVVSSFYTRVPISRLAQLVGLSVEHTEKFLMDLVGSRTLFAKMDRVNGLVEFEAKRNTAEAVEYWSEAVERCVSLLDEASHLIVKERMLSNVQLRQRDNV